MWRHQSNRPWSIGNKRARRNFPTARLLVLDQDRIYGYDNDAYEGALFAMSRSTKKKKVLPTVWSRRSPIVVWAMAVASEHLIAAGTEKTNLPLIPEDEGSPVLLVVDKKTGKTVSKAKLPAAPGWDGMAVADGRILLSTRNGRLICLAAPTKHGD